jgi:DNA gyrase subunit A
MRYTEARITSFALDMISQLDRDTVNFDRNFDDTLDEPVVLPAAIPNMLVNGASGIAVGMATNIPPHNLGEVVSALDYMLERWEKLDDISVIELMKFIQGPDFPTGGIILQNHEQNELLTAYATGRGKITLRGRVNLEEMGRGKSRIIISELPYMTNKSSLIERIAELSREGGLEGIADLRDESDRQGMRIVIELNKSAEEDKTLRELYKKTPLEVTYGINLLALVDNEPRVLSLKQALKVFLEHRIEVVKRRCEFDLQKALERLHILEGLKIAISALDEIIATIRSSQDADQARERLMKKFKLSKLQAQAILDMPLKRLSALERKKIEQEYKEISEQVKELQALLKSPKKMRQEVGKELDEVKQKYQDRRRTQIVSLKQGKVAHDMLTVQDVTPAEITWVGLTAEGNLFRTIGDQAPRTSGREAPVLLTRVDTHQTLYLVSGSGKCVALAVHAIPAVENLSDGALFYKTSALEERDKPVALFGGPVKKNSEGKVIVSISKAGLIKKSAITDLPGPSAQVFTLAKVNDGDELVDVIVSQEETEYLIATNSGMAIRFNGTEVRSMGLIAAGVNAVKLGKTDQVVGLVDLHASGDLMFVGSDGLGWRIQRDDFPVQGRYGRGS